MTLRNLFGIEVLKNIRTEWNKTVSGTRISPEKSLLPRAPIVCLEDTLCFFSSFMSDQDFWTQKCTQYPNIILISMSGSQRKTGCHSPALSTSKKSFFSEEASKTPLKLKTGVKNYFFSHCVEWTVTFRMYYLNMWGPNSHIAVFPSFLMKAKYALLSCWSPEIL